MYEHFDILTNMIRSSINADSLIVQSNGLTILSQMCTMADMEDVEPLLEEFMPEILQQFQGMMSQLTQNSTQEFTMQQSDYISSIVDVIATAAESNPSLFEGCIDMIMTNFLSILKITGNKENNEQFGRTMVAMSQLTEHFNQQMKPYIEQLYPILIDILKRPAINASANLTAEGEADFNQNTMNQQTEVLSFIADFLDEIPLAFQDHWKELMDTVIEFTPMFSKQASHRIYCIGQLLHMLTEMGMNIQELHGQQFPSILKFVTQDIKGTDLPTIRDATDLADSLDSFGVYGKWYLTYCIKSGDKSTFDATVQQLIDAIHRSTGMATNFLQEDLKDCKAQQEIGQDEYDSAMTEVHQDFQDCMEEIGICYQMIIKTLGEKCPHDVAEQICKIAVELLNNDVQTKSGQLMIIEGVSLFADFSEHLPAELAHELM